MNQPGSDSDGRVGTPGSDSDGRVGTPGSDSDGRVGTPGSDSDGRVGTPGRVHPVWWAVATVAALTMVLAVLAAVAALVVPSTSRAIAVAARAVPELPAALGFSGPRRYLLAVLNPAELRASGGAPLSVALVTIDQGRIRVDEQGQTSTEVIPGNPKVAWEHVTQKPYPYDSQPSRFVNANQHPDFRLAGEELRRAWVASGKPAVDGVIAIDTQAIVDALRETGPVSTELLGEVTADNFEQKWIDSYRTLNSGNGERQAANDEVAAALMRRAESRDGLLGILRALSAAAPGRHVQVRLSDPALQEAVQQSGLAGMVSTATGDHAAWFAMNNNASKTDVFAERRLRIEAVLAPDGGARVTQSMTVTNAVPAEIPSDGLKSGYGTVWNASRWTAYVPGGALETAMKVPVGWKPAALWTDGLGRTIAITSGWLARGQTATMTLTYELPPGTFDDGVYLLTIDPQPVSEPTLVTVTVTHPDGRIDVPLNEEPLDRVIEVESRP